VKGDPENGWVKTELFAYNVLGTFWNGTSKVTYRTSAYTHWYSLPGYI